MKKQFYRIALLLVAMIMTFTACGSQQSDKGDEGTKQTFDFSTVNIEQCIDSDDPTDYLKIVVKDYGTMIVRLYPETAPITVAHIKDLVSAKFYNGLSFHRVYKGFMIQGGDIDGDGMTNEGQKKIKGEFSQNGVQNDLSHVRGVISMARTSDKNSASSQFFIMHKDASSSLDGGYAAFGYVVYGIETVDRICECECTYNGNEKSRPVTPVIMETVSFVNVVSK